MSARLVVVAAALVALVALPALYLHGTAGTALYNGDEAIYAQLAREMVRDGRPSELRFDGENVFPRPPGAIWAIAAVYALRGEQPPEPAVRGVNAGLCALAVALTILVGARLISPLAGLTAGGLLAGADLFAGYARVYESEPLLSCCVLVALLGWSMRSRGGWIVFGLGLGGALLTKQFVGFLPLAAPLADLISARRRREPAPSPRGPLIGIAIALCVALPWHLVLVARHGGAFVDAFFVRSLIGRGQAALLHRTSPAFYLRELFVSERAPFALLFLVAATCALLVGLWRGRSNELLLGGWALGVLGLYSLARSRYDYYLLVAYPAFALCAASMVTSARLGRARPFVAALVVALAGFLHLPRNLERLRGDEDMRILFSAVRSPPNATIYTFALHPYTARIYGDRPVQVFVETQRDLDAAAQLRATGMPAPAILASPPSAAIELVRRPALLVYPRARADLLAGVPADRYQIVGETARLRLLSLP